MRRENGEELYCPESRVLPDFRDRTSTSIFEGAYVYHGIKEFTGDGRGRIGVAIELFSLEELASFGIYPNEREFLNNEEKADTHRYDEEEKNLVPRPSPEMPVISKAPPPSPETPVTPKAPPVNRRPVGILNDQEAKGRPILETILKRRSVRHASSR